MKQPSCIGSISSREKSYAAFAMALPKIYDNAMKIQRPYVDKFLAKFDILYDAYAKLPINERQIFQNKWVSSEEFSELQSIL